jgi:hypothetical protein
MAEFSLGQSELAQQALAQLAAKCARACAYGVAEVHAWRGDKTQAFQWLERSRENGDGEITDINYDPMLNSIRNDARFKTLLSELKLPSL